MVDIERLSLVAAKASYLDRDVALAIQIVAFAEQYGVARCNHCEQRGVRLRVRARGVNPGLRINVVRKRGDLLRAVH